MDFASPHSTSYKESSGRLLCAVSTGPRQARETCVPLRAALVAAGTVATTPPPQVVCGEGRAGLGGRRAPPIR